MDKCRLILLLYILRIRNFINIIGKERINNMSLAKDITIALINDNCIKGITPTEKFKFPCDVQESIERVLESRKIMVNIK